MVQDNGSTVDYVGVLDDIIQVSFRHIPPTTIFKIIWYKDNVRWNDCLMHSIKHTEEREAINLSDEPFVFPESVEQVFFAEDVLDRNWSFVIQNKIKTYRVFELIEPMDWNDGHHLTGLDSGEEREEGIPRVHKFVDLPNDDDNNVPTDVDETYNEYESESDDEEIALRGVEDIERVLDNMADDFEDEDEDYESRRTRSMSEL
jgi:hypothetical protein